MGGRKGRRWIKGKFEKATERNVGVDVVRFGAYRAEHVLPSHAS